jgi:hypothetical protein
MIKIEHGNLSINGSGEETTADLLSVLTGYREMLIEQGGLTPERAGDFMETICDISGKPYARQAINCIASLGNRTPPAAETDEKKQPERNDRWVALVLATLAMIFGMGPRGDEPQA